MILEVGTLICAAVAALVAVKDHLAKAPTERRNITADHFEKIAVCLEETAKSLRAGVYPGGRCGELAGYAQRLPSVVELEIGKPKAAAIAQQLIDAHEVELLFGHREDDVGRKQIDQLEEAAGAFRALGNNVRAGS